MSFDIAGNRPIPERTLLISLLIVSTRIDTGGVQVAAVDVPAALNAVEVYVLAVAYALAAIVSVIDALDSDCDAGGVIGSVALTEGATELFQKSEKIRVEL